MTGAGRSASAFERRFEIAGDPVYLRLEPPEPWDKDFICRYTITWPDGAHAGHAGGVDGLQALQLALQGAHLNLLGLRGTQLEGPVTWLGSVDLGLPLPAGMASGEFRPER
ncbi:MAG: hypothetical protein IT546_03820 [Caulobacteraceae bacterium]|nr:hypothetical protein [Caulobacteraceae bacterium]